MKDSKNKVNDVFKNILSIINKFFNGIKTILNFLSRSSIQSDKICIVKENSKLIYSLRDNSISSDEENINNIKNCILSDSLIELKVVKVPVVEKSILKNIIINMVKKYSTVIPDEDNISYIILNKEEKQFEVLVFIKRFNENLDLKGKQLFSNYHIISNLIKLEEFPENSSFIINSDDVWFLYSFKERKFRRRDIYYKEDLKNIKKSNVYYINLFSTNKENLGKKFIEIPYEKINQALLKLRNNIFIEQKKVEPKILAALIVGIIFVILIIGLEIYSFNLELNKKKLIAEMNNLSKVYESEKSKRGISDDLYKEFIKLISKKSNVNDFFKNLYLTGKDNIQIERLFYNNGAFTISGYCEDDSRLEDFFRKTKFWKDVNFSFSRKNGKIIFNISGKFINE